MKDNLTQTLKRAQSSFNAFTVAQKLMAVLGSAAIVIAGVMMFKMASTPSYSPLFTGLAGADASAIVEELDSRGVKYQLTAAGTTIMVPSELVYETRVALSGEGLPSASRGGYSLLDEQDLSTSQFKEQTDFKRAMEGELAKTVEAIDGVETAVVHLAMPPKRVFADEQDPTTASVLVRTRAGTTLQNDQVQAVVNLVASSIDGLAPEKVTVADASGRVLTQPTEDGGLAGASTRTEQVEAFQNRTAQRLQTMLDRVIGSGNATVSVTADLNFDQATTETTRYFTDGDLPPRSESRRTETYEGPGGVNNGGVVGPDGQLDPDADGADGDGNRSNYDKRERVVDNAISSTIEKRQAAPGGVESLHVGVVVDTATGADPADLEGLVVSSLGIDEARGDTVEITALRFDRADEEAAAAELEAAEEAKKKAQTQELIRNAALGGLALLILGVAWLRSRRRNKQSRATRDALEKAREAREIAIAEAEATAAAAAAALAATTAAGVNPASALLSENENAESDAVRGDVQKMTEKKPDEAAQMVRAWMSEGEA